MATTIPSNNAPFSADELRTATGGQWHGQGADVCGVSIDSRRVDEGGLFVAVRGERTDGHEYASVAAKRGASAIVCERPVHDAPGVAQLLVTDSRAALGEIASHYRQRWGGTILGITGSAGKTSCKELSAAALGGAGESVVATKGNLNNLFGLPMTMLSVPESAKFGVLEMGTSEAGEIERLGTIASPDVGVVTLVSAAHTLGLGGIEQVRTEKASLFRTLPPEGTAIANADDPEMVRLAKSSGAARVLTFGKAQGSSLRLVDFSLLDDLRTRVTLQILGAPRPLEFRVRLLGEPAAYNAAAAIAGSFALGVEPELAASRLEACEAIPGRLFPMRIGDRFVLDDSYNASPRAGIAALHTLVDLAKLTDSRPVAFLGDMKELGSLSRQSHQDLIREAIRLRVALCVGCGPEMVGAASALGDEASEIRLVEDGAEAAQFIDRWTRDGDLILIKGSRSMRMEQLMDKLREIGE